MATRVRQSFDDRSDDRLPPWPLGWRSLGEFGVAYVVLVTVGVAIGFALTGPLSETVVGSLDRDVARWFAAQRTPSLNGTTATGSGLANTFNVIAAIAVVAAFLTWRLKRWKESLTLVTALSLEALTFVTVSLTVGRSRPPVEQLDTSPATASFPSGHTGAAFAFYLGVALIIWWHSDSGWARTLAILAGVAAAATVALSRMYRGMHYLTDVVFGALFGIVCLAIAAAIVQRAIERRRSNASA